MSHVNAEKTIAGVVKAGTVKMMDPTMGKMGMDSMMMDGMGSMMKGGMGPMMKTPGVATGVIVYTGSRARESVIKKIFTHPLVLFSLGVVVGCYVYKYRKSIISASVESKQEE